jgi:hypothetical protein
MFSYLIVKLDHLWALLLLENPGSEGLGRKNFKIRTQETDGPNYCYAVYTFPVGYKSLVASCITPDKIKGEDPFVKLCSRNDVTGSR